MVERVAVPARNVHAHSGRIGFRGQQIRRHDILDEREVASLLAIAVDDGRLASQQSRDEARDHRRVLRFRILARAEYVEVPQPHGLEPVDAWKHLGEHLRCRLGDRVGGHRIDGQALVLGQGLGVAVDRRAARVDDLANASVPRREKYVQTPLHVRGARIQRILDRTLHGRDRRLVVDGAGPVDDGRQALGVPDVQLVNFQGVGVALLQLAEIFPFAVRKVVDHPNRCAPGQQRTRQM